jgi:hypothetical protein
VIDGAWKATRPAPSLSLWLVRFAFYETVRFEGTPLEHPAHGLRPRYPCIIVLALACGRVRKGSSEMTSRTMGAWMRCR